MTHDRKFGKVNIKDSSKSEFIRWQGYDRTGELGRGYDEKGEQEGSEKKKHSGIISFREGRQKLKKNGFQQIAVVWSRLFEFE